MQSIVAPAAQLLDRVIADPRARDKAKLELLKLQSEQEIEAITAQMQAVTAEPGSTDPWVSRARPSFLYVMYALILWALPMGLVSAFSPATANAIAGGMSAYLRGLPEELYALFGTGYLGYTAARAWQKVRGVER
ncbi:MAG TPA: holin family protein [Sphingomicrobium sp.]|jgi:hypothetical protein|nr:holin family protein [Sphingomicrobium sp.]